MRNSILKWPVIGGVLLTLFIPLVVAQDIHTSFLQAHGFFAGTLTTIVTFFRLPFFFFGGFSNFFFPFITGKGFAFRMLVEIVGALWLIWALYDPSVRPKKSLLLYAAGAFLLSLLISVFLSINPDKSFWSNFERMEGWVALAHLIFFFVIVFSVFTDEKRWKLLWNTAIGVSVVEGLYGIGQLLGGFVINQGGVRVDGTFGNATYLAIYMLFSFFMTLLAISWWGRGKRQWLTLGFYGIAILLQVAMIFYTATRGTILGLVGGLFIAGIAFLFSGGEHKRLRNFGIATLLGIIVLSGGFFFARNTSFVQNHEVFSRLASIATPSELLQEGSTRFAIWHMAWEGFLERPVFGWGQESFNYVFNKFYTASLYNQEPWFDRAHNEFIDWLVAGGAVGFVLYLSLFGIALYYLWSKGDFSPLERGLLTGLLAAYAFHDLFVFDNLVSYMYFFIVLAYIAWRAEAKTPITGEWAKPLSSSEITVAAPIIIVAMAIIFYFVNIPGLSAASDIIQGLSSHTEGIPANFDAFKKAVSDSGVSGLGAQEVHEQLLQFGSQVVTLNAGDQTFQKEVTDYATKEAGAFVASVPQDARVLLFYGSYLLQTGQTDAARTALLAALKASPQKQQILFELAALDATQGNIEALSYAKQAYDLDPTYDTARITYAAMAIRANQRDLAQSLLMPRFGTMTPDNDVLLGAYITVKDYVSALTILKHRVAADPNNYQAHLSLAGGYLEAGDQADAILEVEKAIELQPAFATQGQAIIQGIRSGTIH
jgi:O-antigen ligase/tetratricopeptide (TPR) repeat protein